MIRTLAHRGQDGQALFPVLRGGSDEIELVAQVMAELDSVDALNLTRRISLRDFVRIFSEVRGCVRACFGSDEYRGGGRMPGGVDLGFDGAGAWGFADLSFRGESDCPIGRECVRRIASEAVAATIRRALTAPRGIESQAEYGGAVALPGAY